MLKDKATFAFRSTAYDLGKSTTALKKIIPETVKAAEVT